MKPLVRVFISKKWNVLAFLTIFVPAIIVLSLHSYLGSFSRLIADDFCSYYYAKDMGLIQSAIYWYRTWHGGYSVSFMDYLLVLIGPSGIPFVTPLILIIWLAVTTTAAYLSLGYVGRFSRIINAVALGVAVVYSILLVSPNVPQSLYWWGGMRAYILPVIIFSFYLALHQWFRKREWEPRSIIMWSFVSFVIVFVCGGFSETFTPVQLLLFIFFIGFGLLARKFRLGEAEFYFLLAGYFGALLSLIAMVAAPGNSVRQALYPEPVDLFSVFFIAMSGFVSFLHGVLNTPENFLGLLGMTIGVVWIGNQLTNGRVINFWSVPMSLFTGLLFTSLCFLPAAYGLGAKPYNRTLIIPASILVVSILYTGFTLGRWLTAKTRSSNFNQLLFFIITIVLIIFSTVSKSQMLYASRNVYIDYAEKWDQVDLRIKQARLSGEEEVLIPNMINWAGLDRPTDNPKFWLTACYSQYYGIQVLGPAWEW